MDNCKLTIKEMKAVANRRGLPFEGTSSFTHSQWYAYAIERKSYLVAKRRRKKCPGGKKKVPKKKSSLDFATVSELKRSLSDLCVTGYSKLNKKKLIALLKKSSKGFVMTQDVLQDKIDRGVVTPIDILAWLSYQATVDGCVDEEYAAYIFERPHIKIRYTKQQFEACHNINLADHFDDIDPQIHYDRGDWIEIVKDVHIYPHSLVGMDFAWEETWPYRDPAYTREAFAAEYKNKVNAIKPSDEYVTVGFSYLSPGNHNNKTVFWLWGIGTRKWADYEQDYGIQQVVSEEVVYKAIRKWISCGLEIISGTN